MINAHRETMSAVIFYMLAMATCHSKSHVSNLECFTSIPKIKGMPKIRLFYGEIFLHKQVTSCWLLNMTKICP